MSEERLFSLKMRASRKERHISGAERILAESGLAAGIQAMLTRALEHANGEPDFINFKAEALDKEEILHLDALPVRSVQTHSVRESLAYMSTLLRSLGIVRAQEITELLPRLRGMRGAVLLHADTLERLEKDPERGVRVTCMDSVSPPCPERKNHFAEALTLAAKTVHAPGILAELCISDDPDYVTGYLASKQTGYVRITPLKEKGNPAGGRIFLFRGNAGEADRCTAFLEKQPVLVHGMEHSAVPVHAGRMERIRTELRSLRESDLFRTEKIMESAPGPHGRKEGKNCLVFASNNYLDLANDPRVKAAACEAAEKYGAGSGGSRLTSGTMRCHKELEEALSRFKQTEDSVLFGSGYAANTGCITALCGRGDTIYSDELNHASIIDGCRLSGARIVVYRHNDMEDLERKLRIYPCSGGLIVSDAVFSMDGDIANLPRLLEIAEKNDLFTLIDEAHANGVIGRTGHGVMEHFGLTRGPDLLIGTLSKAFGAEGGFAACSCDLAAFLRNRARSYIFSTSMPPAAAAAAREAVRIIQNEPEHTSALQANAAFLRSELCLRGLKTNSETAIIPVSAGESRRALEMAGSLEECGIFVPAIRYPSVPEGEARLRISLMSTHSKDDLFTLADALADVFSRTK